jgi:autoinducer 2 (AI-2) kinase
MRALRRRRDVVRRHLLGLDVGGGGGRALLVDADSGEVQRAFRAWVPSTDTDVDLESVWRALAEASREVLSHAGSPPGAVVGMAATSMRLGAVLLDARGEPVYAGWNRDLRPIAQGLEIGTRHGAELARVTGRWPVPNGLAARAQWLALHHPERLARARSALSLGDWVAFRLCGERVTDFSQAAETLLLDVRTRSWAWDWIERLGLPRELFPPIAPSGTALGKLGDRAAHDLGLAPGTPVALGGGDTQCGLLGCGARAAGDVAIVAGTTAPVQQVLAGPAIDPEARLWSGLHVAPEHWVVESNAGPVGEALDWLAHLLYRDSEAPVAELLADAGRSPAGAAGALSTFGATVFDARALRPSYGCFSLSNLGVGSHGDSRALFARGAVEGLAHALRANLEQIVALTGESPAEVRLCGGLSRSADFAQILADVLERPVAAARVAESSGLGAALCAGVGAGCFRDLDEAATLAATRERALPDAARARILAERYAAWNRLLLAQPDVSDLAMP